MPITYSSKTGHTTPTHAHLVVYGVGVTPYLKFVLPASKLLLHRPTRKLNFNVGSFVNSSYVYYLLDINCCLYGSVSPILHVDYRFLDPYTHSVMHQCTPDLVFGTNSEGVKGTGTLV